MTVEKDYGYAEKDNDFIEGDVFVVAMYRFYLNWDPIFISFQVFMKIGRRILCVGCKS
jgi:hypothetical protein